MDKGEKAPPNGDRLQAPLARLLRPLVRLLVRSGVTFPALVDLLRELYVNVAEYDFALADKNQTDSRVSLLTGIHRKEVRRLRGAGAPVNVVPAAISRTSRILSRWIADARYTDPAGRPRPLPRVADGEPSFEELVTSVTRDVRPRAVLDEWVDRGLARIDPEDRVTLVEEAYVPRGGDDQELYFFGRNLHDHIAAAVANVEGRSPSFLERGVHYDGLSPELATRLQQISREAAIQALIDVNREAHAACETDRGGSWRWNFGVYVYVEEVGSRPGTAAAAPPDPEPAP